MADTEDGDQTDVAGRLLAELRRAGDDGAQIEAKRAKSGFPQSLWETISAFANTTGGFVLLGVEQRGGFQVTGVDDPGGIANRLASLCSDEMEPPVRAEIWNTVLEDQPVIVARIPAISPMQRPCHLRRWGPLAGSRVRVNDGDRQMSAYEVSLWLSERQQPTHDRRLVAEATIGDLNADTLARFVARLRTTRQAVLGTMDTDEILRRTHVTGVDADGTLRPTLAGLFAFGIYPQQFFPQLNLTVVVYPTDRPGEPGPRGERFVDNRSIDGDIPAMLTGALDVIHPHLKRRGIVQGLYRVDEPEYPIEVLREAIVNALAHRDYSAASHGAQVQIELYPNRLMARNPGGLYGPVDVSRLGFETLTSARNPVLLKLLEDVEAEPSRAVCENRGSGLATVRELLGRAGMNPPSLRDNISTFEFEVSNESLIDEATATWLSEIGVAGLRPTQLTALAYLRRRHQRLTNSTYRTISGIRDSRDAGKQLRDLVERGLLVQLGDRGAASYTLAEPQTDSTRGMTALVLAALGTETLTAHEVAERLGVTRQQAATALSRLRRNGLVALIGVPRSKNARWHRR